MRYIGCSYTDWPMHKARSLPSVFSPCLSVAGCCEPFLTPLFFYMMRPYPVMGRRCVNPLVYAPVKEKKPKRDVQQHHQRQQQKQHHHAHDTSTCPSRSKTLTAVISTLSSQHALPCLSHVFREHLPAFASVSR